MFHVKFLALIFWGAEALADPYFTALKTARGEKLLDYFIVTQNDNRHILPANEVLRFIKGDRLRVIAAVLKNGSYLKSVNVYGYSKTKKSINDLGQIIDTSRHLRSPRWAVDPAGERYALVAAKAGVLHGLAYFQRYLPRLDYVEVEAEGETKVLRPGQTLEVNDLDFDLGRVATNVDPKELHFKLWQKGKNYELVFRYRQIILARIPVVPGR